MSKHLKVIARPKNGFRRAGFRFSPDQETLLPVKDLSKEQIETLRSEPNLVVVEIDIEDKAEKQAAAEAEAQKKAAAEAEAKKKAEGKK